jgi:serine/threonine protein kinase
LNKIADLKPNESYRLDKADTGLLRTLTILRHKNGEFQLIGETKSKIADNTKQELPEIGGGYKSGKPAWRLDIFEEYFNLVTILENEDDLLNLQAEVKISQDLASDFVNETQLGPVITIGDKHKVSVYSKKANGTLKDLLKKHRLTPAQKDDLILQLLMGVKYFHDRNLIHQDLKPANILFYGDRQTGFRLKLTDFGCTSMQGSNEESLASLEYISPEIAHFYATPETSKFDYFQDPDAQVAYGNQPLPRPVSRLWGKPDKANDIWALGIIIHEIRYGKKPGFPADAPFIAQDPFLNNMLQVNRNHRCTIDEALNFLEMSSKDKKRTFAKP